MADLVEHHHEEVVETQTVTTKTEEDGSVVTEITVTKIVTGDGGEETTTIVTTTEQGSAKVNGESEPTTDEHHEDASPCKTDEAAPEVSETTNVEVVAAPTVEVAAATASTEDAHVEEEKKEEQPPPSVVLHQFPAGRNIPSYSMYCLKLETFLRINKIPFTSAYGFKAGKKGKLPWLEHSGEKVPDSSFCIDYLNKSFGVDLDKHLSAYEKAVARAFKIMMEENSNWTVVYHRWVDDYSEFKKLASPPGIGFTVGFKLSQRKVKAQLEHHGIGRHSREEIYEIAEKDLTALNEFLGDKKYFMGDQVSTLDCTAFGFLANCVYDSLDSPMGKFVKEELKNLVAYCERMKEEFYPDWCDVVQGDKPEPNLSKKYSFRKNKKKKPVTAAAGQKDDKKEESGDAEAAATNDCEQKDNAEETAAPADGEAATPAPNGDASDEHHEKATATAAE